MCLICSFTLSEFQRTGRELFRIATLTEIVMERTKLMQADCVRPPIPDATRHCNNNWGRDRFAQVCLAFYVGVWKDSGQGGEEDGGGRFDENGPFQNETTEKGGPQRAITVFSVGSVVRKTRQSKSDIPPPSLTTPLSSTVTIRLYTKMGFNFFLFFRLPQFWKITKMY